MLLIKISNFTQKRLNIKKTPKKWNTIAFNSSDNQNESSNELHFINPIEQKLRTGFIRNSIFKIFYSTNKNLATNYENFSWTVKELDSNSTKIPWQENQGQFKAETTLQGGKKLKIAFDQSKTFFLTSLNDEVVFSLSIKENKAKKWLFFNIEFINPDYNIFGLGEQTEPMDKKGKEIIFWNTDNPTYRMGSTPLYQSWPITLVQQNGFFYTFICDNPAFSKLDMQHQKEIKYFVHDLQLNFYIFWGSNLKDIMEQLAFLFGTTYPLPKWALGYQQSRYSYTPSNRVREIAKSFRDKCIPCDVIYLDIHYMDNFKCFTFGNEFTDYKQLIDELHELGFKVVPIIDPGIKIEQGYPVYDEGIKNNFFLKDRKNNLITIKVWPGDCHFPDFLNKDVQNWWSSLVQRFVDQAGIDGIWCDMNEPSTFDKRRTLQPDAQHHFKEKNWTLEHEKIHNIFGFFMTKATVEGLLYKSNNPFVLTRSSYLGGQKYASAWTGDNHSDWAHLKNSIPSILSLGLSGQPVVGSDIGGFTGIPDPKLYERWIIQGAFYPFSRTHTAIGTPDQEPWSFGENIENIAKATIKLRYKLIPYYYSLLYEAFVKGYPIMRPIFFNEINRFTLDKIYYESEFLLGDFLLFAPYMTKSNKRDVYLPPGEWYSWWKKEELFVGDSIYPIDEEDNEIIPIFLSDHAIIPMSFENLNFVPKNS